MNRTLQIGAVLFGLLFVYSAVVQYNDPDPFQWMLMYGVGALICGLYLAGRLPRLLASTVAVGCFVWALALTFVLWRTGGVFDDHEMIGVVERGRELMGLILVGGWSGVLAWMGRDGKKG